MGERERERAPGAGASGGGKKARAFAAAHDLTPEQARALIARHGDDPDLLEAAAEKILKPEDDPGPDTKLPHD